ncbi:MAG: glutamate 5-kinase [Clostridia bacterium]|nr:glutamate 5-kinase [Clostridia bacterium]
MRIVVKVGSSTLTYKTGRLNIRFFDNFCKILSDIKNEGHEIVIVSSGAIALGVGKLNLTERPSEMAEKQAVAAVGQCELIYSYDKAFAEYGYSVAQILVTGDDLSDAARREHFTDTIEKVLEMGIIPVVNENDTVSTTEISVGDNDRLAAVICTAISADMLILLSDVDGLYDKDPHKDKNAHLIKDVDVIDDSIMALCTGSASKQGTGGMITKINAAKACTESGTEVVVVNGGHPDRIYAAISGEDAGTRFRKKTQ